MQKERMQNMLKPLLGPYKRVRQKQQNAGFALFTFPHQNRTNAIFLTPRARQSYSTYYYEYNQSKTWASPM
jgi:hypothetical protein